MKLIDESLKLGEEYLKGEGYSQQEINLELCSANIFVYLIYFYRKHIY